MNAQTALEPHAEKAILQGRYSAPVRQWGVEYLLWRWCSTSTYPLGCALGFQSHPMLQSGGEPSASESFAAEVAVPHESAGVL